MGIFFLVTRIFRELCVCYRDNGKYTDVVLKCADGSVRAHRLVLSAASKFLRTVLLDAPTADANVEGDTIIILPEIKRPVLAALLDFVYTVF